MQRIANILVALDFSAASVHALDEAIELASTLHARIFVCHAFRVSTVVAAILGDKDELAEAIAAGAARELVDIIEARLRRGVETVPVIRHGRPPEQILAIAEEVGADLVVVGAHDRHGRHNRLLHGNIATKLMRETRRLVLTVCSA
jgi:nucleotide-binding universal stress UspA family protein